MNNSKQIPSATHNPAIQCLFSFTVYCCGPGTAPGTHLPQLAVQKTNFKGAWQSYAHQSVLQSRQGVLCHSSAGSCLPFPADAPPRVAAPGTHCAPMKVACSKHELRQLPFLPNLPQPLEADAHRLLLIRLLCESSIKFVFCGADFFFAAYNSSCIHACVMYDFGMAALKDYKHITHLLFFPFPPTFLM